MRISITQSFQFIVQLLVATEVLIRKLDLNRLDNDASIQLRRE